MAIATRPLCGLEDWLACERLQQAILGDRARLLLHVSTLAIIDRAGGLLLGAWEESGGRRELVGALVDLVAEADGFPSRFTAFLGTHPHAANRGVAQLLRASERDTCLAAGVGLVFWWADPLRSNEAHIAFNRLGAISNSYRRDALGVLADPRNAGLSTDRLRVEWWLEAPRVESITIEGREPPHFELGLDRMHVLTQTSRAPSGERRILDLDALPDKPFILVEIPADLDRVRATDIAEARRWRLVTREAFEILFANGYVLVGFVHEGGRSFHLLERAERGDVLGRS